MPERPYTYYDFTLSLCPHCLKRVDAKIVFESFVSAKIEEKYDLIIGNPPYIRWKNLDEELKRKLSNLLKSPDILQNYGNYSKIIIEELKDHTNNTSDKQKLTKLIADYLTVDDIQSEIKCNLKYFANDIEFDGHFKLPALITDEKIFDKIYSEAKETKDKKEKINDRKFT